ncbi:MAG: hypothetical protein PHH54_02615 [Candidatus Nanoarchaeia archaeon]|nr:hypothetical protein [Candidatus Nanoarchaeia archaeon]MDD5740853.1 hypothetical protein [Candidatus Nanoarchaeia archaeon]
MAVLYPVMLTPPKSAKLTEKVESLDNLLFAIISSEEIITTATLPGELGVKYMRDILPQSDEKERAACFSYECPIEIIVSGKEIYKVRSLGTSFRQEFEKGLSADYAQQKAVE